MIGDVQTTPYIVLKPTEGAQTKVVLSGSSAWTLGRDNDNTIVIPDSSVSRHHAILQCLDSTSIYLIDLGSTNGSFVNQRRVSIPTLLQNGDHLTLGQSEIEFYSNTEPILNPQESLPGAAEKTSVLHLRRLISVGVVDIRGFTQLTQQVDEQLLSKVLGEWFRQAGKIIRARGSQVDKYIGDAIMAVWLHSDAQTPPQTPITANVVQSFEALRDLFEMTDHINQSFPLPRALQVGAGLNTGYAVVGQMGSGERQEYTVIGDTVNAAFRLESATRVLDADIAVSEETHAALCRQVKLSEAKSFFRCENVLLKGYNKEHPVYYCHFQDLKDFLARLTS